VDLLLKKVSVHDMNAYNGSKRMSIENQGVGRLLPFFR